MLAQYGKVDIALDPFPFSGGLTTCEALWIGVPVVTLAGETLVSRQSASLLMSLGKNEWVAESPRQHVETVLRLAADPARLSRLRRGLRAQRPHRPCAMLAPLRWSSNPLTGKYGRPGAPAKNSRALPGSASSIPACG